MLEPNRWAWRPQEGPQQALVVRLRSFAVKLSWRRPIVSISAAKSSSCPREHPRTGPRPTERSIPASSDHHALPHATRKLMRIFAHPPARLRDADKGEHLTGGL